MFHKIEKESEGGHPVARMTRVTRTVRSVTYLNIIEAAGQLSIEQSELVRAIQDGSLQATKVGGDGGGGYRISRSALEAFAASLAQEPAHEDNITIQEPPSFE